MNGIVATASIDIEAPASRVWTALTEPDQIAAYMFGSRVETDWEVGHPITWNGEWEGKPYQDKGQVLAYDEPERLSVTHFSPLTGQDDLPESYHTLVYELDENDGVTTVSLSQDNNGSEEEAEHSRANWQMMLDGLKKQVEGN
ncbi:MAG TPA: SRPBCC family protein [Marmoricola sp.]